MDPQRGRDISHREDLLAGPNAYPVGVPELGLVATDSLEPGASCRLADKAAIALSQSNRGNPIVRRRRAA